MIKLMKKYQHRIFPVLDIALNAVNYIFHVFVSWFLLPVSYGMLNSLLSLLAILMVVGIAFQTHTAQKTAVGEDAGPILKAALAFSLIITFLLFMLAQKIEKLIGCDKGVLVLIGIAFAINVFISVFRGYLQGKKEFLMLNISFYIEVLTKILVIIILLPLFKSIAAVLAAIITGMTISLLHALYCYIRIRTRKEEGVVPKSFFTTTGKILWIYAASFFFYYFTSIDMIIVNYYLRDQSGIFAVAIKYAQIAVFVSISVVTVFLPSLSSFKPKDSNFRKYLLRCLGIVALAEAGVLFLNYVFMPYTVDVFFKESYGMAADFIFFASLPYAFLGLCYLMINANIARERKGYLWILLLFSVVQMISMNIFNHSIKQILTTESIVYFSMFSILLIHLFKVSGIFEKSEGSKMIPEQYLKLAKSDRLTLLFLSWRDIKCPKAGGAEVYTHEMLKRVDFNKYRIVHLSPLFQDGSEFEELDNIVYIRKGGLFSVILFAIGYYLRNRKNIDLVVDQCNTHQFLSPLWVGKRKRVFFIHQLTREIWRLNAKPPAGRIGEFLETHLLRLSRHSYTMTVSQSTKKDLLDIGFEPEKVFILPEGIEFEHWKKEDFLKKEENPTFIYVGRFVNYKGIDDAVKAFVLLRKEYPGTRLWIVGKRNENYIKEKLKPLLEDAGISHGEGGEDKDVTFWGFVSDELKLELMSRAHALVFPSRREGWGLIVTEAAAVGTPSIGYNSPGIVDALDNGNAGYMCSRNNPEGICTCMKDVVENRSQYDDYRNKAYQFSLRFHWKHTAQSFDSFVERVVAVYNLEGIKKIQKIQKDFSGE